MKRALFLSMSALAATTALIAPGSAEATPSPTVVAYDATLSPLPGNVGSVGFEANGVSELGDEITFEPGSPHRLNTVTVTMSSWACQHGAWNTKDCSTTPGAKADVPITLNIYTQSTPNADGTTTPGRLIARVTKTFAIPYRPSANFSKCNTGNGSAGKWFNAADQTCYNGKAANIVFNFKSLAMTLPDTVVLGVAYNTSDYGDEPVGHQAPCFTADGGCFYDSLNVGTDGDLPSKGSNPDADTVFQSTVSPGSLCDATPALGVFNLDSPTSGCWDGAVPNLKVTTY